MAKRSDSAVALEAYRESVGLTARAAARELRVTHVAVLSWESGARVPGPAYREALSRWSAGRVSVDGWGLSKRDQRLQRRLAEVVTHRPTGTG